MDSDELTRFFRAAARHGHGSPDEIMCRVLHVDTRALDHLEQLVQRPTPAVLGLFTELDFEVRARNPGLHYVFRARYIGYRRETERTPSAIGARSQVFLSVVPREGVIKTLLPLSYEAFADEPFVESVEERGHHGVGTIQCSLRNERDLDRFLTTFGEWLGPRRTELGHQPDEET